MSVAHIDAVILACDRIGMPVNLLRYIRSNYRVATQPDWLGFDDHTNVWVNEVIFNWRTVDQLEHVYDLSRQGAYGITFASSAVGTVYHEFTHAYFDLQENRPHIRRLIQDGIRYYTSAPLKGGGRVTDPERVFHEAAGEYCDKSAGAYFGAYVELLGLQRRERGDRIQQRLNLIRDGYNQNMRERMIVGYQDVAGKKWTTKVIMPRLQNFIDRQLLEGKITPHLLGQNRLRRLVSDLNIIFPGELTNI